MADVVSPAFRMHFAAGSAERLQDIALACELALYYSLESEIEPGTMAIRIAEIASSDKNKSKTFYPRVMASSWSSAFIKITQIAGGVSDVELRPDENLGFYYRLTHLNTTGHCRFIEFGRHVPRPKPDIRYGIWRVVIDG